MGHKRSKRTTTPTSNPVSQPKQLRVSCSVPAGTESDTLLARVGELGVTPIVTSAVVRAVYEGPSYTTAIRLVELFEAERDHEICSNLPH